MASYTKISERGAIEDNIVNEDHEPSTNDQRTKKFPKLAPLLGDAEGHNSTDIEIGTPTLAANDDPFHVFREDLIRKMNDADRSLDRYLRLIFDTDTAVNTHEIKDAKKQCKRCFRGAESALKDLQRTVRLVENSRGLPQFRHIDDDELMSRQNFIAKHSNQLSVLKNRLHAQDVKDKVTKDERALAVRRLGNLGTRNNHEQKNTNFIIDQRTQSQVMMRQQDDTLDDLGEAVIRVGNISSTINEELGDQNKMLKALDEDLTDAEEKLGFVMGKLAKLLKTTNKCQLGTILTLSLIVVILFFLVLYL